MRPSNRVSNPGYDNNVEAYRRPSESRQSYTGAQQPQRQSQAGSQQPGLGDRRWSEPQQQRFSQQGYAGEEQPYHRPSQSAPNTPSPDLSGNSYDPAQRQAPPTSYYPGDAYPKVDHFDGDGQYKPASGQTPPPQHFHVEASTPTAYAGQAQVPSIQFNYPSAQLPLAQQRRPWAGESFFSRVCLLLEPSGALCFAWQVELASSTGTVCAASN